MKGQAETTMVVMTLIALSQLDTCSIGNIGDDDSYDTKRSF